MSRARKLLLVIGLGLVLIFLQGSAIRSLLPWMVLAPNLLLSLAVFLAFFEASTFGCILVFVLGLQLDLSSGVLLGPWAGSFVAVFCLLASLSQRLFIESSLAAALAVFASSLFSQIVYTVLTYDVRPFGPQMIGYAFLDALVCALLAPWMFKLYRKVFSSDARGPSRYRPVGA